MQNNLKLVAFVFTIVFFAGIGIRVTSNDDNIAPQTIVKKASWYRPWTKAAQAARWARSKVSDPIRTRLEKKFPRATEIITKIDNTLSATPLYGFFWKRIPYEAKVLIVGNIIAAVTVVSYKKGRSLYGKYTQPRITEAPLELDAKKPMSESNETPAEAEDANSTTVQPPMTKQQLIHNGIHVLGIDQSKMSKEYKEHGTQLVKSLNLAFAKIKSPEDSQALYDRLQSDVSDKLAYMGEQKKEKYDYNQKNANAVYTKLVATADVIEKAYPDIANYIRENLRRYIKQVEAQK